MISFTKEEKSCFLKRIGEDIRALDTQISIYQRIMAFKPLKESDMKDYEDRIEYLKKLKDENIPFYNKVEAWINEDESTTDV